MNCLVQWYRAVGGPGGPCQYHTVVRDMREYPEPATFNSHGCACETVACQLTGRMTGGRRVRNVAGIPSCYINQQLYE